MKESKYKVWTRLNCVSYETSGRTSANERKRNSGGTNIDFVGIDIYGTNASKVKGNMDGQLGTNGKNFRMIMEIDAKDANSPVYQMAALPVTSRSITIIIVWWTVMPFMGADGHNW